MKTLPPTTLDMLALDNVVLAPELVEHRRKDGVTLSKADLKARVPYNELFVRLATIRPSWKFKVIDLAYDGKTIDSIKIFCNGEELGEVRWHWFRNDYGFLITNDRLRKLRERRSSYCTHDATKALAAIKKHFFAKSTSERFDKVEELTRRLLDRQKSDKEHKVRELYSSVRDSSVIFANSVREQFVEFLKTTNKQNLLPEYEQRRAEMLTIDQARKAFASQECALVLREGAHYVVKVRDKVEIFDDTTLPAWMRGKLGLLKLVEDDNVIQGVGCRVDPECFVLLLDAATQGEGK
jgi:hypothetical protein